MTTPTRLSHRTAPVAPAAPALAPVRWASVARDACWATSQTRHLVRRGAETSFCGTTALPASLWRGNTTKGICPTCEARALERAIPLPDPA